MTGRAGSVAVLAAAVTLLLPLGGCSPTGMAVGAASHVGVAAVQERGLLRTLDDTALKARIGEAYLRESEAILLAVTIRVHEGRVLLIGALADAALRQRAVDLARAQDGVKEVIDELQPIEGGIADYAQDSWITAQINAQLTFDPGILAVNYQVDTVRRVVYLFGIAQDQLERDLAIRHAGKVRHVRRVVSHLLLKDDPRRPAG